uniref:Uncharacterized protein n=1 Tax=Acanthochromis polyacanthus TaxID=80966 RepID=A0A3Q1EV23_9TELE
MCRPCRSISRRLGSEVFQKLYENLKEARGQRGDADGEDEAVKLLDEPNGGFQVDQLLKNILYKASETLITFGKL